MKKKAGSEHLKHVVITGASSGIGRALALAFGGRGCRVGILDIDMEGARETLELVERSGGSGETFFCDVSRLEDVEKAARHFFGTWGRVDLLFNNAGIGGGGFVGGLPIAEWEKVVNTDYWGVVYGCHSFIPGMKAQGGGHIVNTASSAGIIPIPGFSPYVTSKAAVVALSQTLKMELAPFNIDVTVICPPPIETNIIGNTLRQIDVEGLEEAEWGINMVSTAMKKSSVSTGILAEKVIEAVEKNRLYVLANLPSRITWLVIRLTPSGFFKGMAFLNRHGLALKLMNYLAEKGLV